MQTMRREDKRRFVGRVVGCGLLLLGVAAALGGCVWIREWLHPNNAPVAVIQANPTSGGAPLEVLFDASESYDHDGDDIAAYIWDFGGGRTSSGSTVTQGFATPGEFTVRLSVTDARGKTGTTAIGIIVLQPHEETLEHTFAAAQGAEFDTGAGLRVSIPPAPVNGQTTVSLRSSTTPPPTPDVSVRLHSVHTVSFGPALYGYAFHPQGGIHYLDVRFDLEVPQHVDPEAAVVVMWTSDGWRLAPSAIGAETIKSLGGSLSPDRRHLSLQLPMRVVDVSRVAGVAPASWWKAIRDRVTLAVASLQNTFDCSPVYPIIEEAGCEDKGTYFEKRVSVTSPERGFGGIWFKVEVVDNSNTLIAPPQWEPPNRFEIERVVASKGWYLSPSDSRPGLLRLSFPLQGGKALVVLDAGDALAVQMTDWVLRLVPLGDLFEGFAEYLWGTVAAISDAVNRDYPSLATSWGDAVRKGLEFAKRFVQVASTELFKDELARHLFTKYRGRFSEDVLRDSSRRVAGKLVDEVVKPLALVSLCANILTYNWTIASRQAGYCAYGRCTWEVMSRARVDSNVTLTLYVHEGSASGPVIVGARVQGNNGAGTSFDQTTNSSGYVTITGAPGTWSFTASKSGYRTETWEDSITVTETRRASLQRDTQNQPPVITSLTTDPSTVQPGGQSRITVSARDPENDPLTYSWSASGGNLSSTTGPGEKAWTAPNTAGTYRITVTVTDNQPGRSSVSRSVDIAVTSAPTPVTGEIVSTSVNPPSPVQVGQQVVFSCTVRNTGGARHTFVVGLSVWRVGSPISTAIIDTSQQVTLDPNQQQAVTLRTYAFTSDQTGDWNYQFGLWRDQAGGTLLDKKPSPAGVLTVYRQLPDLVVEDVWTVPNPPVASDYTTIGVRIRNKSEKDVAETFLLALYFDTRYYGRVSINGLAAGMPYTSEWRAVQWPSDTNLHMITAVVDYDNKVLESNEGNNELAKQFQAVSPPQQVGTLFIESVPGGATVYVDGQYKGITPTTTGYLRIDNLSAGDHAVRVSKTGYKDWIGTVTIPPGKTTYKAVFLEEDVIRLPSVETRVATNLTETSAVIHGAIISDGGASIVERGFAWGTTSACADGSTNQVSVSGNTFSFQITGLQPGSTCYFRARARNSQGWAEGAVLSFRTLEAAVQAGQIVSEGVSPSPAFAWRSAAFSCRVKNTGTVRHTFPVTLNVWRPGTSSTSSPITFSPKHITLDPNQEATVEWTTGFREDQTGNWSYQFSLWKDAVGGTLLAQRPSPPRTLTVVKFKAGDPVYVYGTGSAGLRVRDAPCGTRIDNKPDGATGVILEGPVACVLGGITYTWWKIRWSDGRIGWSVENYLGLAMG